MGIQTASRQDSRVFYRDYTFANLGDAFSSPLSATWNTRLETVSSYRGKVEYINVGKKRRKVFHPFNVWKYYHTQVGETWFIDGTRKLHAEDYLYLYPRNNLGKSWPNWQQYNIAGDPFPNCIKAQTADYANDLREFVVRDLYSKANAPRWDALVFLAELDETLVGIRDLLIGCWKSWRKTEAAWKYVKHFSLNSNELWLWYRYMLMPTMLEIESILQAIKPQDIIDRVQDGDRSEEDYSEKGTFVMTNQFSGRYDWDLKWDAKIKYGLGGAIDMHSRFDPNSLGTSPWDLLRAGWERIPYSFIVDWLVNIGDYLDSLRSLEVVYAQSYATVAVETNCEITYPDHHMGDTTKYRTVYIDRIVDLEPPKYPLIDKRWFSIMRSLDLISLSIGIIKRILKRRK